MVNCHQNTEAADLLGGLRPLRGREALISKLRAQGDEFMLRCSGIMGATPSQFSGFSMENDVDRIISTLEVRVGVVPPGAGGSERGLMRAGEGQHRRRGGGMMTLKITPSFESDISEDKIPLTS